MPRLFLSYRRDDTAAITGRIDDHLRSHFGRESVFRDLDSIPGGLDFREQLERAVTECDVLLAIIGERWLSADGHGKRRLDDPDDYVRMEIGSALKKNKAVLPVLVGRALMPSHAELPTDVAELVYQNAVRVEDEWGCFHQRMFRLIRDIEYVTQKDSLTPIINTVFRVVSAKKAKSKFFSIRNFTVNKSFPIWNFTLMNRATSSQVINHLECNVVEYIPILSIPKTRVLNSIAVWDIGLPYGVGPCAYSPSAPILVASNDAVTVSLRFHCIYEDELISPHETAAYALQVRFVTDQQFVAASECFWL